MKNKAIYALYSNGKFVSWLYGAFCQLTSTPKIYGYNGTDSQSLTIQTNLKYKIKNINNEEAYSIWGLFSNGNLIEYDQKKEQDSLKGFNNFQLGVFYLTKDELDDPTFEKQKTMTPDKMFDV